jgi:ABC-type sugar transport system ATPase subunit
VQALCKVDFEVGPGEVHGLVGENGAGKSTLMHILAGVLRPDEGTLLFCGHEVHFSSARKAQEAGIAMVFQERSLAGPLSVAENVFFGRQPVGAAGVIDQDRLHREARRILGELGIPLATDRRVEDLSPAEQQMVEIAKALSLDARLLVLDEPTSALTDAETQALFAVIRRLTARGAGIVYISHRLAEVFEICDRMTVLRDGRCQGMFSRGDVSQDDLIRRMVGRELAFLQGRRTSARPVCTPVLEAEGIEDGRLLKGVSFKACAGEITALAGLSGSGRTELALCLFGARPMTAGRIRLQGREVVLHCPGEAIRAGIGYLPEDRRDAGLFLEMGVAANGAAASLDRFGGWWLRDRAMEQQVLEVGSRLRLAPGLASRSVQELSGGNQQKVMLTRWLLVHPPILIVDEPTRGIDIGAKTEVHHLLRELAAEGMAIILISSELAEVLAVADRILVMREGRLAGELAAAEATEEKILRLATMPCVAASTAAG